MDTKWIADWMWRPGMNSKQALVYRESDPEKPRWCDHRHIKAEAAKACAERMAGQLNDAR